VIVARGLGRRGTPLVTSGLGRVQAAVVQAAVEAYSGGWYERPRPTREEVDAERRRLGILPPLPAAKTPPAPAPGLTAPPAAEPYDWREPGFDWGAVADARRLDRTLELLADEALYADMVARQRMAAALQAAQARRQALLREESDLTYVLAALAAGQGTPVELRVLLTAPAELAAGEEADMAFVIATVVSIA